MNRRAVACFVVIVAAVGVGMAAGDGAPPAPASGPATQSAPAAGAAHSQPADASTTRPTTRPTTQPTDAEALAAAKLLRAQPEELVRVKWVAVLAILKNSELDQRAKEEAIGDALYPVFDFGLMAKLALGSQHWQELTAEQQTRYVKLFVQRLRRSYQKKITGYSGESVVFDPKPTAEEAENDTGRAKPARPRRGVREVSVQLVLKDRRVDIVHKFRKTNEQWMIYDVEIKGVSIVSTYRSQFSDVLRGHGAEVLLERLEQDPPQ